MLPCFNTAGPCVPGMHYMLSPAGRFSHVMQFVNEAKFFTIHAGRQTGKTTAARWLVDHYNEGDRYSALWVDVQTAREQPDPERAFRTVLNELARAVQRDLPELDVAVDLDELLGDPSTAIHKYLVSLATKSVRPLVLFIDEADGLVGQAMVSFLTQLRAGYIDRSKTSFAHALALIGMRQVRDYVISTADRNTVAWLGTTSPFNITAESATLGPFTLDNVNELLGQHTTTTAQVFLAEAVERIFHLSQGHPWLVNALADQVVNRDVEDRSVPVAAMHVDVAKETIILERRTHIDSLIARLREPRVRRIIEPMLTGRDFPDDVLSDDLAYVTGLGLVVVRDGRCEIANPIYREVIPRALTYMKQIGIAHESAWYLAGDGSLDMAKLMVAWQKFWRQDGHLSAEGFAYREAGPHLMLMAFLQRIVNSGGRVEREYGLGRGALDLMVSFRESRYAVEIKLRRDTETQAEALEQVLRYLDFAGLDEGWLVFFDLRKEPTWDQKLFTRDERVGDKLVHIVGC